MYTVINRVPFEKKENASLKGLNDISILIKTLERPVQLINLLYSIQKYGFEGPVVIGDDSKQPYKERILGLFPKMNITYIELPFDAGTAEGRNRMLDHTHTPLFVLCDDDFIFEARTRIPVMRKMLLENELDILGGVFLQHNMKSRIGRLKFNIAKFFLKFNILIPADQMYEYQAGIELHGNVCKLYKVKYHDPFTMCDLTHNFFIARTEKVKAFKGWNPVLKGGEHQNFFIRAKLNGLKVATTRQCGVIHDRWSPAPPIFKQLRDRGKDYQKIALSEFGIDKMENFRAVMGESFG